MASIKLPFSFKHTVLALGSETNTTFSLLSNDAVFLSDPYRDLKDPSIFEDFKRGISDKKKALRIKPDTIACDMHPEYISSKYARDIAKDEKGVCLAEVQHHHAHIAACMAENGLIGKVIGVAFDGTGYGADGKIWGGEFLIAGYKEFERVAHIAYVPMPGGDRAVREPIRMVLAYLYKAYGGYINKVPAGILERLGREKCAVIGNMMDKEINSPLTSSAGRLFDAVSSLLGIKDCSSYEGEAAIMLEEAAKGSAAEDSYNFKLKEDGEIQIDFSDTIKEIVSGLSNKEAVSEIAKKFHNTLAEAVVKTCAAIQKRHKIKKAVLTGGVFQNKILLGESKRRLEAAGFTVYTHRSMPSSDISISAGQAVIAASRSEKKRCA